MTKTRLFCDTSFFFALCSPDDPHHEKAQSLLRVNKTADLVTTWEILGETLTLLRYRAGFTLAAEFVKKVKPHLEITVTDDSLRNEALRVFLKFGRDKRLSYCDCVSFVFLQTELKNVPVLTFDKDFKQFGFSVLG